MLLIEPVCIAQDPWHFGDFRNIFLPSIGEKPNKVLPSELVAPGTMPYGKSGPGYCITFKKSLIGPEVDTFRKKTRNIFQVIHLNWLAKFELKGLVPRLSIL